MAARLGMGLKRSSVAYVHFAQVFHSAQPTGDVGQCVFDGWSLQSRVLGNITWANQTCNEDLVLQQYAAYAYHIVTSRHHHCGFFNHSVSQLMTCQTCPRGPRNWFHGNLSCGLSADGGGI
eukprot:157081-Amphidinium_carterae.3